MRLSLQLVIVKVGNCEGGQLCSLCWCADVSVYMCSGCSQKCCCCRFHMDFTSPSSGRTCPLYFKTRGCYREYQDIRALQRGRFRPFSKSHMVRQLEIQKISPLQLEKERNYETGSTTAPEMKTSRRCQIQR
jgi:hypothetical protein